MGIIPDTTWVIVVAVLLHSAMSAPVSRTGSSDSDHPLWVNPCNLPDGAKGHGADLSAQDIRNMLDAVSNRARVANQEADRAKQQFLERTFSDSEFEHSVAYYTQSWLPDVPDPTEEHFSSITKEEAFKNAFGYVQYYAVGLEQAVLDQIFHNGPFQKLFLEIQQNLGQLLCELQIGIVHFNVDKNPDVLRDVMSHEYRDIKQDSQRNLRDYLILREYIKVTQYIFELFAYLRDHS
ncbi:uncharacterized protein LOC135397312 isoform X2 [Ornithodoros turicata]|uniref:uncharacterized protein LOC135397312 isoform X2 n=1 Tax=Ornithodoros turicata TaxID=34597 RepID=UPI0031390304